jgi:predicted transport protein
MNYLEKYKESPYLLTEDEIKAKPLGDILELVKHIEQVVAQTMKDLNVHLENAKSLKRVMTLMNEGVSE